MPDLPTDAGTPAADATAAPSPAPSNGDVDAELERLPPARHRRSPIAALAVIAVAALLLVHLAPDLRYATSEQLPVELGQARSIHFDNGGAGALVGSSRVDLQACKLEYSIVSPK